MIKEMMEQFIAHADSVNPANGGVGIQNPLSINSIPEFVNKLLEIVVQIGIPILVVSIVYVGFLFVTARGSDDKLTEAKKALLYSVIGAAIILGAFIISSAIKGTIDSLKP